MTSLNCQQVSKTFGEVRAVHDFDLTVEPGSISALVGPSGCGKTTVLRLIAGFERPDTGTIESGTRTLSSPSVFVAPERRRIGMVFQEYALFPHMDVARNVAYGLDRNGPTGRVNEVLELVGLEGLNARYPHQLSGGQQQRVALARALAPEPDMILLDEPFSNLDATLRNRMRQEIREILMAAGVTTVFVTHDQEEALSLADSVAVMRGGHIEQTGTPEEVYGTPQNRWAASFLGDANIIPGTAGNGWVECELARFAISPGFSGPANVVIRLESVALGSGGPAPGGRRGVDSVVVGREFYGHDQIVHIELPSGHRLRSRRLGFPAWHPGDRVRVWIEGPVSVLPREASESDAPDAQGGAAANPAGDSVGSIEESAGTGAEATRIDNVDES